MTYFGYLLISSSPSSMKFEQFLNREAVPEWRPKYLNYHLLKDHLKQIPINQSNSGVEEEFFADARLELRKIDRFYALKQQELTSKYSVFLSKRDLATLYTESDFLKSFRSLNITAVRKILKKFVKVTGNDAGARGFQTEAESFQFWSQSAELDTLSTRIEDTFTKKYAGGDRHRAMRRLRLRYFKNESFHTAAMFAGIFWSSTLAIIIYIFTFYRSRTDLIYIYASHFLPLMALGMFSVNSLVFKRAFVNYRFVFQFDKRTALHECQYAAMTGIFALVFAFSALIVLSKHDIASRPSVAFIPLISVLLVLLNPTPWPWYSSRLWILKTFIKIFSAPLSPVIFKDFFINDHLISQAHFFQGILMAFSLESTHWSVRLAPTLPNLTRTFQCLRRYKDTRIKLNLVNAFKYTLSIFVLVLRSIFTTKSISIDAIQAASSMFSLYWDLVMDFGLLQMTRDYKNMFLRDQLVVFSYKIIYYYVILFDCFGRFAWILSSYSFLSKNNLNLLLVVIEVLRRFHWSFLRIEYEHLNNCNSFRAVDDTRKVCVEDEGRAADLFYKDMVDAKSESIENNEETPEEEYDYEMTETSV